MIQRFRQTEHYTPLPSREGSGEGPICTLAAIDLGSNAIRLLIKDNEGRKLQFVRIPLRLGIDVFGQGKISKERESQLIRSIKAFRQLMIIYNVADYRACATSAMRDAKNGRKILHRIAKDLNVDIEIISGQEEARIICDNHIENLLQNKSPEQMENYLYMDVGGGSTEISLLVGGQIQQSVSYDAGTLRMLAGGVSEDLLQQMRCDLRQMAEGCQGLRIIGSGGNINKLYRIAPKKLVRKNVLPVTVLQKLYGQLSSLSVEDRMREFELRADRADVIVPAAQLFLLVAEAVGATEIVVPTIGLADGIINELKAKINNNRNID